MGNKELSKYDLNKRFIVVQSVILFLFLYVLPSVYNGNQDNVFFQQTADYFADYFNVIEYSKDNNPYFYTENISQTYEMANLNGEQAYFPLTYVIMNYLSEIAYSDYGDAYVETKGMLVGTLFLSIAMLIYFILIYNIQSNKKMGFINTILLVLCGINLFSFERGNIIYLSAICCLLFLKYYNSKNNVMKNIAFVALAIAAALKGYPAVLGFLLLYEKRYKDAMILMLYGIAFAFLPFLLLENGFQNIPQFFMNLGANNTRYLYGYFPRFNYLYLVVTFENIYENKEIIHTVGSVCTYVFALLTLFFAKYQEVPWKKYASLLMLIVVMPTNSAFYGGLYILPIILMFFEEKRKSKTDYIYLLMFILFINPLQIVFGNLNITHLLVNLSFTIFTVLIFISNIKMFKKYYSK